MILTNSENLTVAGENANEADQSKSKAPPQPSEAMEVDENVAAASSSSSEHIKSDPTLIQFIIDVLTAAGHKFEGADLQRNSTVVTANIRAKLLPFVRCCAIYAHFLTDVKFPKSLLEHSTSPTKSAKSLTTDATQVNTSCNKLTPTEEYDVLTHYLGMPTNFSFLSISYLRGVSLFWPRHSRIANMFTSEPRSTTNVSVLRAENRYLTQPHLINRLQPLPHDYSDLINSVAHFTCPNSDGHAESRFPTMCLVCGEVLCSQNYCCRKKFNHDMIGACTYHTMICGAGTGIFLRIRDCKILMLTSRSRGKWTVVAKIVRKVY